jgi:hypothetical protein
MVLSHAASTGSSDDSVHSTFASRYVRTSAATAMTLAILIVAFVLSAPAPEIVYKAF